MATARGYILEGQAGQKGCSRQFACQGRTQEEKELQLELNAVVDNGGVIHYLQLITGPTNRACPWNTGGPSPEAIRAGSWNPRPSLYSDIWAATDTLPAGDYNKKWQVNAGLNWSF